jgi:N6-L-threonylcarbamoyladenine synthase
MIVLGIETSCDETSAAVVKGKAAGPGDILGHIVLSQAEHTAFGGVVPEIAARAHVEALDKTIAAAMSQAGIDFADLDGVAATAGPGLIGALLVGLTTGKAIAMATGKPLAAVNHLEAHALTPRLTEGLPFPYLLLLVSGGHTQLLKVSGVGDYQRYGTTIDDALGEAFDKAARLLGLPYPGGPAIEAAAADGDPDRFPLPRPMLGRKGADFSFSGLKTAIRQTAESAAPLSYQDVADLGASFQKAVANVVRDRTTNAMIRFEEEVNVRRRSLVVAGGVAANAELRSALALLAEERGFRIIVPPAELCTDNAAMVAWTGIERLEAGLTDSLDFAARPRWPLDTTAATIGGGAKGAKA